MLMLKEDFDALEQDIKQVIEENGGEKELVEAFETGQFPRANKVKDLQKRFCFDLFHATKCNSTISRKLYEYLNDDHIYTALKRVCPKVVQRYSVNQLTGQVSKCQ